MEGVLEVPPIQNIVFELQFSSITHYLPCTTTSGNFLFEFLTRYLRLSDEVKQPLHQPRLVRE